MVKYTREQRLRAVRLYEQYDRSAASVINELGYPSRQMLVRWHRAWVEAGRDDGGSLGDGRGERYTPGQKRAAVDHYLRHGRCAARTIRALGYPCKALLARWVDELEPGQRPDQAGSRGCEDASQGGGRICLGLQDESAGRRGAGGQCRCRAKPEAQDACGRRQGACDGRRRGQGRNAEVPRGPAPR